MFHRSLLLLAVAGVNQCLAFTGKTSLMPNRRPSLSLSQSKATAELQTSDQDTIVMDIPTEISSVCLKSRPVGRVQESDLEVTKQAKPVLEEGQILVKNIYISIDPTHRIWMSDIPQYMDPVALDEVMRAATVGQVVESKNEDFPVGSFVSGGGGVSDFYVGIPGVNLFFPVQLQQGVGLSAHASVLSLVIGYTAWYGVNKVLEVKKDDVVVISGAAGAVGSLAAQLAKKKGAKVIGVAGGEEKCEKLLDYGVDVAINYKDQDVSKEIKKAAPDGITCYFDNVGGTVAEAALDNFQNYGRYCLCGSISEYEDKWSGIKNFNMILMRRLKVQGFICSDNLEPFGEFISEVLPLVAEGKLKYDEDVRKVGLDQYVATVNDLFDGKNTGKLMMQVADEPPSRDT